MRAALQVNALVPIGLLLALGLWWGFARTRAGLLVRMAVRRGTDGDLEGYVVAFDDVTELVTAQRMAAWGDVARRVAHEIKNPLTPIQLSAERLRRKFGPLAAEGDRAALDQYTEVIIRQTNDLRRIVDEFSRFARMPEPDRRETDLARLLREAVVLQQDAIEGGVATAIPDAPAADEIVVALGASVGGRPHHRIHQRAWPRSEAP